MLEQNQKDALEKAYQILNEHFESGIIVVTTENTDDTGEATHSYWFGGFMVNVGHAEFARWKLLNGEAETEQEPKF